MYIWSEDKNLRQYQKMKRQGKPLLIIHQVKSFLQLGQPEMERFEIVFQLRLPGWRGSVRHRILSMVLVFAILGTLGILGYVIVSPTAEEKFTEFYVLDEAGSTTLYPRELSVGMAGNVVLHIVNHEYQDVLYRIEIRLSGVIIKKVGPVKLQHGQKWEQDIDFIPVSAAKNQKVEFLLFKGEENEPYLSLHLWLDVNKRE